jgi:hypothetical protein
LSSAVNSTVGEWLAGRTPDSAAQAVDLGQQPLRSVELAINKCRVEDQLCLGIGDLGLAPRLDPALHRLKVSLDAVHSD